MIPFQALKPVQRDEEFERIVRLPRREWDSRAAAAAAEQLTPQLLNERGLQKWYELGQLSSEARELEIARCARRPDKGGDGCPIRLMPTQATTLTEAAMLRGFFGALPVGKGKTLTTYLLPHFFPEVRRPILTLPGGLTKARQGKMGKTEYEFEALRRYWREPQYPVEVVSYSLIARREHYLDELRPDLMIDDEADLLKNEEAATTRRIRRYCGSNLSCINIFMTGTMMRLSPRDFMLLLVLALKGYAPVPIDKGIADAWCEALDENPRSGIHRHPGALLELSSNPRGITLRDQALDAFGRRIADTPGVIICDEASCDLPLYIRLLKAPDDPLIESAFSNFRENQVTEDGWDVSGNFEKIQYGKTLGLGFFKKWKPRPPQPWLDARREYHKLLRYVITNSEKGSGKPIDSAKQAALRVVDHPKAIAWREIEETFKPNTEPHWISMSAMAWIAEWIRLNKPALIWTQDIAVGESLEDLTGVRYYGGGGVDRHGGDIEKADTSQSAIVSIAANMRGRNLWGWNRALVISPPQPATEWEQGCLGRMHRQGQTESVFVDVLVCSADALHAVARACNESRYVKKPGFATQKLLTATWDWSCFPMTEIQSIAEDDPRHARWFRP